MLNVDKRIAALERLASARQRSLQTAIDNALGWPLGDSDLTHLLSASGADADHRPLTEPER